MATALDLKERLVSELRAMNDVAETNARSADAKASVASPGGTVLEPFQRQYASTVLKVRECNAHVGAKNAGEGFGSFANDARGGEDRARRRRAGSRGGAETRTRTRTR